MEDGVDIGPLIDQNAVDKVQKQIDEAISSGAKLEAGGKSIGGLFFNQPYCPTLMTACFA